MAPVDRFQHATRRSGAPERKFFDLLVPEHAYLFGLLQTDGNHTEGSRNRSRISIELAASDDLLLYRLRDLVPWYSAVRYRERTTNFAADYRTAIWTLSSWDARSELTALGLPPGPKSRTAAPPSSPHAQRDYVRGLIDGDGSVGFTGAGRPFVSLVTASEGLARYYEAFAEEVTGVRRRTNRTNRDGIFNPMHQTDAAAALASFLYQPGDLALDRKAAAAKRVGSWRRPPQMRRASTWRRWTPDEDLLVMAERPLAEVADDLGRSYQSVSMRRVRLRSKPPA